MADPELNRKVVQQLMDALSDRDWTGMQSVLADDVEQVDMGTSIPGVTGPDAVAGRMSLILDALAGYELLDGTVLVAEGDLVAAEIKERWTFPGGKQLIHPWACLAELRDGRVFRWHCYSNAANVAENAPAEWLGQIAEKLIERGEL